MRQKQAILVGSRDSDSAERAAFSLIELLVVMAIIGLLATIGLPALRGLGTGNSIAAANRQLLDDLAEARQRAINNRSTVFMVFVSPTIVSAPMSSLGLDQKKQLTNIINGQFTSYALFTSRTLGDQPGRSRPRYLTEWRHLPEGIFIATNKYAQLTLPAWGSVRDNSIRPFPYALFPLPGGDPARPVYVPMPYIAFDYKGQLLSRGDKDFPLRLNDEVIELKRGSVIYPQSPDGRYQVAAAEVVETMSRDPRQRTTNYVNVDWLTGRARSVLLPSLQ